MSWRRASVYFGLFVALAAYYVATEPRSEAGKPRLPARLSFLEVDAGDVQALTIESQGTTVRCVRDGERWRAEVPAHAAVPSDLVTAMIDQLTQVPDVEVVDETGQRAAQFGLAPPQGSIRLRLRSGRTVGVDLGGRNPAQTAVYGRVQGSPRIVLVGLNILYYEQLILQAARSASS